MGKQWKQCQTLFFGGSKITADGDCSHEIKRHLLSGLDYVIDETQKAQTIKKMIYPSDLTSTKHDTIDKVNK